MRIDPQRLIRLAVLIEHGSFGRAADHLGLTQPALSQSIAQIEKEVGVKLIERTSHGVEPTVYGRVLYDHAKLIDRELVQAALHIQELAFGRKGTLAIGATVGGAASLVALALCKLQGLRGGIDIRVNEEASIKTLLTQLHDRTVDMLICQRPLEVGLKGTRALPLFKAKRVACMRADHPLTGNITLKDLCTYPFVCPPEEMGSLFGFRQIFANAGLQLPEVLVSNSIYVAKEIVLNSDAFALFSDLSVLNERRLGLLKVAELDVPTHYWMQLIVRSEHTPTDQMKRFVAELLTLCKELHIDVHADAANFRHLRAGD